MKRFLFIVLGSIFLVSGISYAASDDYVLVGGDMPKKHVDFEDNVAVSAVVSTLGVGIEGAFRISEHFNVRAGVTGFQYDYNASKADIDYDFDLTLLNFPILIDYFPAKEDELKHFRVTAGIIPNANKVDMDAEVAGSYSIGGTLYTAAEAGRLTGEAEMNVFAPYIGFGLGNVFVAQKSWQLSVDAGVMFMGSPDVSLSSSGGTLSSTAAFQANLRQEEDDLEDKIDEFDVYPVISFRLSKRF